MSEANSITASASKQPVIQVTNLSYSLQQNQQLVHILTNLNLTLYQGEQVAILGASGAGKSTLLALLAGLDIPTAGTIQWRGQAFSSLSEDERAVIRAQEVGFVFQSFQLLPELTALENVMLPLELKGHKDAASLAKAWLDKVGLSERMQHRPSQLSGGEQQRVALARAFVTEPRVLFADEPTGNLDAANGDLVADLLFQLHSSEAEPGTLIVVTHDLKLAQRCQRIIRLEAGQLVAEE